MAARVSFSKAIVKAALLLAFIVAAVVIFHFTSLRKFVSVEAIRAFLDSAGFLAPLLFILIYAIGVCLFIPATLLTTIGAALFGPYQGFVYVWLGAMLGACLAFFIGRYLGRELASSLAGERLKRYDDAIEKNGFAAVLYLRLIYFPFTVMNFGMGLTKVRFWDYFFGTALGILVGTFVFTFLVGTIRDAWAGGDWGRLLSPQGLLSLGLFVFSLFIPKIVKKIKSAPPDNP